MFPIKLVRENVHKTQADVEIARVFIEWDPLYNKKGDKYEIQVSKITKTLTSWKGKLQR